MCCSSGLMCNRLKSISKSKKLPDAEVLRTDEKLRRQYYFSINTDARHSEIKIPVNLLCFPH